MVMNYTTEIVSLSNWIHGS